MEPALQKKEPSAIRQRWRRGLPQGWIHQFVMDGLVPFLEKKGYKIRYREVGTVRSCSEWAAGHVLAKQNPKENFVIPPRKNSNPGSQEELDRFLDQIPSQEWITLCERWSATQFLDDSAVGYAQQMDLPYLAWRLVDLQNSPAHRIKKE